MYSRTTIIMQSNYDVIDLSYNAITLSTPRFKCSNRECPETRDTKADIQHHQSACVWQPNVISKTRVYQTSVEQLVRQLAERTKRLEQELDIVKRLLPKPKQVIVSLDWLNRQPHIPVLPFGPWIDSVPVTPEHFDWLLNADTHFSKHMTDQQHLLNCFEFILTPMYRQDGLPLVAFTEKHNTLYIYDRIDTPNSGSSSSDGSSSGSNGSDNIDINGCQWRVATHADIKYMLQTLHFKLMGQYQQWKQEHLQRCSEDTRWSNKLHKSSSRLTTLALLDPAYLNRWAAQVYTAIHAKFPQSEFVLA